MNYAASIVPYLRHCGWFNRRVVAAGAAAIVVLSVVGDIYNTQRFYGVDLRNRIVGARLLTKGVDPYSYFWNEGDGEFYLDGMPAADRPHPANRITVTPPMLMAFWTISHLPWNEVKWWWLGFEWAFFAAASAVLLAMAPPERRALLASVLLLGFFASDMFRFHVEVGQCYVVYLLLFAMSAWCAALPENARSQLGVGFLLGVCSVLRPTFVLSLAPSVVALRGWVIAGAVLGAGCCLGASWPWAGREIWSSYFRLQKEITTHYLLGEVPTTWRYPPRQRAVVDGVRGPENTRNFGRVHARLARGASRWLPRPLRLGALQAAALVFAAAFTALWWKVARGASVQHALLAGISLAMAVDFFIPADRNVYNNMAWASPVAMLIAAPSFPRWMRGPRGVALVTLLALANGVLAIGFCDPYRLSDYLLAGAMLYLALRLPRWDAAELSAEPKR